jgi:phage replication O-like protein O
MGSKGKTEGYLKIRNKSIEKLASMGLASGEFKTIFALIRILNGWHKEKDKISIRHLMKFTKLSRKIQWRTLGALVNRKIIFKEKSDKSKSSDTYYFNSNFEEWLNNLSPAQPQRETDININSSSICPQEEAVCPQVVNTEEQNLSLLEHKKETTKDIKYNTIKDVFVSMPLASACSDTVSTASALQASAEKVNLRTFGEILREHPKAEREFMRYAKKYYATWEEGGGKEGFEYCR